MSRQTLYCARATTVRRLAWPGLAMLGLAVGPGRATAHVGGLGAGVGATSVPTWLTVLTAGVIVGGSFLFTSLLTDHEAIRMVNGWRFTVPATPSLRRVLRWGTRALGLAVLGFVLAVGFLGPVAPVSNAGILLVWAGWWAGYTMSVYLLGNTWPAVNPWRALADGATALVRRVTARPKVGDRSYPDRLGAWPSVVGLLALVWLEVVTPLSANARLLGVVILCYTALTLVGAGVYGPETWFRWVDPVARVFRLYGRIAPVHLTGDGLAVTPPGGDVAAPDAPRGRADETAFVIALLWATTFDGLVSTPMWADGIALLVGTGIPGPVVYLAGIMIGFAGFYLAYRAAARRVRTTADTFIGVDVIRRWFAPSLLPIAAGYHAAHFLGYFVALSPPLLAALADPLSPGFVAPLALPGWFGLVELGFVLAGHVLAVWIAHSIALELFPGILVPIRSQYPFVAVMICYTMISAWLISQPVIPPPYT